MFPRFSLAALATACLLAPGSGGARPVYPENPPSLVERLRADSLGAPPARFAPATGRTASMGPAPRTSTNATASSLEWIEHMPPGPLPRQPALAVTDPAGQHLFVVMGSGSHAYFDDIWRLALDGSGTWTRIEPLGARPPGRAAAAAAYDAATGRVLLFGGVGRQQVKRNDVWALTLSDPPVWTELTPVAAPSPSIRWGAAAVVDPLRRQLVVYGGEDAVGKCGDVWALPIDGPGAWTRLSATASPPPRAVASMVIDPTRDRLVVFGGINVVNEFHGDTQAFDLATRTWSPLAWAGTAPGVMDGASLTYDALRDRLVMFGGNTGIYGVNHRLDGLWSLDLAHQAPWAPLAAAGPAPSPRFVVGTAHDAAHDRLLMFGGIENAPLSDTWSLALGASPAWSRIAPAVNWPNASVRSVALHDARRDRMLVLVDPEQALLAYDLSGASGWSTLEPLGERPPSRWGFSAILDPDSDRVVMFGGNWYLGAGNDVWVLPLSGPLAWRQLEPGGTPPGRRDNAAAVYDPLRRYLYVYGGDLEYDSWSSRNDTHRLNLSGAPAWERVAEGASPDEGRSLMAAAYDPVGDRMVITGGRGDYLYVPSTPWALSFGAPHAWQPMSVSGTAPSARAGAHAALDAGGRRLLLWSGYAPYDRSPELWALDLAAERWDLLVPYGAPPRPRSMGVSIWDPLRSRMLVWGGTDGIESFAELWELRESVPVAVTVSLAGATAVEGAASLRWWWSGEAAEVRIERREEASGWIELDRRMASPGEVRFEDRTVQPGARYEYRLRWTDGTGAHEGGLALVEVPGVARFALTAITPNPAGGAVRVAFSLADAGEGELTLRDVTGRQVLSRRLGALAPGPRTVALDETARIPAGLYWITLRQGARAATARCAVIR